MRTSWRSAGDASAFLGLTFDNVAQLIVFSGILINVFGYPADLVLTRMLPGTAFGVLVGDAIYTLMAVRLARRTGRDDVTAMPLGIDTVSLFGLTFGALGPLYARTHDAMLSWHAGMALMVCMGLFKLAVSMFATRIRDIVPPAAMLGTLGAIGLVLIAFMPVLKLVTVPEVGIVALFATLLVLLRPPAWRVPPVLVVVAASATLYACVTAVGLIGPATTEGATGFALTLPLPTLGFLNGLSAALPYLPLALPFALATVVGGIDNTASAAAAGDDYDPREIVAVEGVSTLIAGLVGGVVQTTPYIGHPAYKRMGARAGYTLATGLFVGVGGMCGLLAWTVHTVPEVVVTPILIYIGLEIASQAFHGVPTRHAPAVALCFIPVLADLLQIVGGQLLSGATPQGPAADLWKAVGLLSNGFVFSSLLLGATLSLLIDARPRAAASVLGLAAVAALFGLIHSPLPGGALLLPWASTDTTPYTFSAGYALAALVVLLIGARETQTDNGAG